MAASPYAPPRSNSNFRNDSLFGLDETALATPGDRLVAVIIDSVLGAVSALPGVFILLASDGRGGGGPVGLLVLAAGILGLSIYQMYLISIEGQTIGKRAMGVRIVMMDGSPCGFVNGVLLRNFVLNFLVGLLNLVYLGWILALVDVLLIFGSERRCIHDLLAGTKVVIA